MAYEWGRREEDEGRGRGMWRCFLKWLLGQSRVLLGGREGGSSLGRFFYGLILCNLAPRGLQGAARPHTQTRVRLLHHEERESD